MASLLGINANTPLTSIGTNGPVSPTDAVLAAALGLATPGLFGDLSTVVELSAAGQLLSAVTTFQDQLSSLQPGTAGSGGGQNFGTDFASLAAETQYFVDAFNGLQNIIASVNGTSALVGASVTSAPGLVELLNAEAQASFSNGNSNSVLTNLSQLGVDFQPSLVSGGGGSLSLDLGALQSAYNGDAAGAFSLLASAANAFNSLGDSFVAQQSNRNSALSGLMQTTSFAGLLNNNFSSQAQINDNLGMLLAVESVSGKVNLRQVMLAMNEFAAVSGLLGALGP